MVTATLRGNVSFWSERLFADKAAEAGLHRIDSQRSTAVQGSLFRAKPPVRPAVTAAALRGRRSALCALPPASLFERGACSDLGRPLCCRQTHATVSSAWLCSKVPSGMRLHRPRRLPASVHTPSPCVAHEAHGLDKTLVQMNGYNLSFMIVIR